jgi:hypothetical protein
MAGFQFQLTYLNAVIVVLVIVAVMALAFWVVPRALREKPSAAADHYGPPPGIQPAPPLRARGGWLSPPPPFEGNTASAVAGRATRDDDCI